MPQSARLAEGGGVQSLFGQCPFEPGDKFRDASLSELDSDEEDQKYYARSDTDVRELTNMVLGQFGCLYRVLH